MSRPVRPIACLWLALPVIFIAGIAQADVKSPLRVELNLPQLPEVGQEAVLDCTLESRSAMKGVSLTIRLPEGVDLVKGSTTWQGDMSVLQIMPLQLTIKVTSPGNKTIRATAFCRIDESTAYSDVSQVFFHSQTGFAAVGHVSDTVPTQGASACLETGEVSKPMKLADYMKLPVQAPITPEPCSVGPGELASHNSVSAPEGTLVVSGRWCYFDRDDVYTPMRWVYVELRHGLTNAVLAYTYVTDNNGQYTLPAVTNPGVLGFKVWVWCFHGNTASCDGKALRVVNVGEGRDDGGNIHLKAASAYVCDVLLHEYGYEVRWDGYGQRLPEADCPETHYVHLASGPRQPDTPSDQGSIPEYHRLQHFADVLRPSRHLHPRGHAGQQRLQPLELRVRPGQQRLGPGLHDCLRQRPRGAMGRGYVHDSGRGAVRQNQSGPRQRGRNVGLSSGQDHDGAVRRLLLRGRAGPQFGDSG